MTAPAHLLADVVAARAELGWRLQLAFAGLHPDSVRGLLEAHGAAGAVRRVTESVRHSARARQAAAVPAPQRVAQLAGVGIDVVFRGEPGYPPHLEELPDGPDLLFVRGRLPSTDPAVAVVGTRRCSAYGRNLAMAYGRAIAAAGWVLVSGLARGIDGAAHRGTVAAGGVGIGVLGCGLDIAYPREHKVLRDQLIDGGGAIVAEYPPGTPPEAWRFPPRNRIISGLARAVVVVEAAIKGGALITAAAALDQGTSVFATPGDIGRDSAAGTNRLIRDGAHPVLDPADLVAELELILGPARRSHSPQLKWDWAGISPAQLAVSRHIPVAAATSLLAQAEVAGELVRRGERYYPTGGEPAAGR